MSKYFPIMEDIRKEINALAERKLSFKAREDMPKADFAIPGKKTKKNKAGKGAYPIENAAHARNALSRVSQFGTAKEKAEVRGKVKKRFPEIDKK